MMQPNVENEEALVLWLRKGIRLAVRVLAILMLLVIWWGVADVVYVLYSRIAAHPYHLLEISDILATFGAFMAVLIAIEIFVNITSYLRDNPVQIKLVLATALMAISRKVIVLDYKEVTPEYIVATATYSGGIIVSLLACGSKKSRRKSVNWVMKNSQDTH